MSLRDIAVRAPAGARSADAGDSADDGASQGSGMYPVIVSAGSVLVTLRQAGATRLELDQDGRRLTVAAGGDDVIVEHGGERTTLARGQVKGFDSESGRELTAATTADPNFERWSQERDRQAQASTAYQHVSPAMTGAETLDAHGNWQVDPTYGSIWYPTTVSAGWAPYRQGRWTWVAPWGWTWVDDAPWGYAPFHYGRWVYVGSRWGWVPGAWSPRPVYSPALVGYYGGGASVTITAGGPAGIGWFPLAPYEPWYPSYYYTPRYLAAVNRPWRTSVPRYYAPGRSPSQPFPPPARYRYAGLPAAATVVRSPLFGTGQPLDRLPVTAEQLRRMPAPTRQTALPALPNRVTAPPRSGASRYQPPSSSPSYGQGGVYRGPRVGGGAVGGAPGVRDSRVIGDPGGGRYQAPRQIGPVAPDPRIVQPLPRRETYQPPGGYQAPGRYPAPGAYPSPGAGRVAPQPMTPLPNRSAPPPMAPLPNRSAPPQRYSPPPAMRQSPPASMPRPMSPPSAPPSPPIYRAPPPTPGAQWMPGWPAGPTPDGAGATGAGATGVG